MTRKTGGLKSLIEKAGATGTVVKRVARTECAPDPNQPRKEFDDLEEFAESLRSQGILENITVRVPTIEEALLLPDGVKYIIAFGERRWRGAELAQIEYLDVVVKEFEPSELWLNQVAENTARKSFKNRELMNAIMKAKSDFKLSGTQIAKSTGLGQAIVSYYMVIGESKHVELFGQYLDADVSLRAVSDLARLAKKHPVFIDEKLKSITAEMVTLDFVSKLKDTLEGNGKAVEKLDSSTHFDQFPSSNSGPDADFTDTDGIDTDGIDTDGIDTDGIDTDGIDTDGIDTDGIDTDGINTDGIDTDGIDTDGIDTDGIDTDGIDTDGTDTDGTDTDGTDTDGTDTDGIELQTDWVGSSQGAGIEGFVKRPVTQAIVNISVKDKKTSKSQFGRINLGIKPNDDGLVPVEFDDGIIMVSLAEKEILIVGYE
ncbi:ParB/RepB/Spo0J family partition protein [Shewanella glacialipiscicola]|uniref:ParB/RepB/Spo0J family partition protein n=1 Tax=Shewanella glacialipiscicola TaxID=614069 RepID=UPI003D7AAE79